MKKRGDFHKVIIGRAEELSLVDYGLVSIPAKTDTGAYRSAIHAANIRLSKDGQLSFELFKNHPMFDGLAVKVSTDKFKEVSVANSFGHKEQRYEVKLRTKLGPKVFYASYTLADRSKKIYPILIGRKMLNDRFLVDTFETSVNRVELKQKYGVSFPKDEEEEQES